MVLLLLVFAQAACHAKHAAVPVPAQPEAKPAEEAPAPQQAPPAQSTPAIPSSVSPSAPTQTTPAKDETIYQKNKPPDQPPPPKRATRPPNPTQTPPATAPQSPPPAAAPPADGPRLGDILTPDQQRQYNAAIELSLSHVQTSLSNIASHQLTKEQEATFAQVQNFVQQAQATRKDDLAAAKSLAERAEVLAHDLVESLK